MTQLTSKDYLAHFGVKGMRWGVRKANDSSTPKVSRRQQKKEAKRAAKQARFEADQKKATMLLDAALKDPEILINLNNNIVVTGKEFVDHMSNGGLMNVRTTTVFAQKDKQSGQYVLN